MVAGGNFQKLSGSEHREQPYREVAAVVHATLPDTSPPPEGRWGATLDWLTTVDRAVASSKRRLLITVDEVERLQDGIAAGWTDTDFLDFVRAAGDALRHTRLLLVSARPIHCLGPHWADRLISAVTRRLGFLDDAAARELICKPVPAFPDGVFPPEVIDSIIDRTARQPYLIQLVCDTLCRRLNRDHRLVATGDDLEPAFDETLLVATTLFSRLWQERSHGEQTVLQALATGQPIPAEGGSDLHQLQQEELATSDTDPAIAVPLFRTWIKTSAPPSA